MPEIMLFNLKHILAVIMLLAFHRHSLINLLSQNLYNLVAVFRGIIDPENQVLWNDYDGWCVGQQKKSL